MIPEWKSAAPCPDDLGIEYADYEKSDRLASLLDGKRVAYVCPGPVSGAGELIDSYDVVVRAGTLKPISDGLRADLGTRADVIMHSFNQFEIPVAVRNLDHVSKAFVVCSMVSHDYIDEHEKFFDLLRSKGTGVQNVDDRYLYRMFREVGTTCNVGFSGLLTLLNYDVSEVYVTGMTFYNMGKYGRVYDDEYFYTVSREMGIFPDRSANFVTAKEARADLHDQPSQIEYFRKLIAREPRIKLDPYLQMNFLR